MAGKSLDWTLSIIDKASSVAKNISKSLNGVLGSLKSVDAASSKPIQLGVAGRFKQELSKAKTDLKGFGSDVFERFGGEAALGAAGAAASVAAAVGVGLLAKKGASMAIDAVTFRENTEAAFESILGSQMAAKDVFAKADALAGKLGLEDEEVVGQLKKLMTSGFGADQALGIVKTAANLAAVRGEGAAEAFATMMATVEAKGKFDTKTLSGLAKLGVRTEDVYASLAKKLGKTTDEVQALAKAGKIDAATGVQAVLDSLDAKFGGAADKMASSVPRLFFRITDAIGDMFNAVDIGPLKNALSNVLAALDGPGGEKIRSGLNKIFGGLFDALFGSFDAGRVDAILGAVGDALNIIGDIVVAAAPSVKAFIGGLIDGLMLVWPLFAAIGGAIATVLAKLQEWGILEPILKGIGYALVAVAAGFAIAGLFAGLLMLPLILLVGAIGAVIYGLVWLSGVVWDAMSSFFGAMGAAASAVYDFFGGVIDSVVTFASEFFSGALDLGSSIIDGLVSGITSGASAVISSIVGVASSAIDAAKSALGIASPSKVFEEMGAFTSVGFAQGVEADSSGQDAAASMIDPSAVGGMAAGAVAQGGAGGVNIHGGVNIQVRTGSGDPQEIGLEVERGVRRAFQELGYAA